MEQGEFLTEESQLINVEGNYNLQPQYSHGFKPRSQGMLRLPGEQHIHMFPKINYTFWGIDGLS